MGSASMTRVIASMVDELADRIASVDTRQHEQVDAITASLDALRSSETEHDA